MTEDYFISTDDSLLDTEVIHGYLSRSYWSPGIQEELIIKALRHSLCFGVYEAETRKQVGFARVVTDQATFAYLADVFVLEAHQGKGLSKLLMRTIMADERLQGLRRWMLATKDAHGLYEQFGFATLTPEQQGRMMGVLNPAIYR